MKKTLIALFALAFAFAFGTVNAAKHDMPKTDAPKAEAKKEDPIAKACADKDGKALKAGTMVKVDGKDVKCPEPKKDVKKKDVKKDEKKGATPATPAKPAEPAKKGATPATPAKPAEPAKK